MTNFKVNLELFDKVVHKEYRVIKRFFDIREAEEFKERLVMVQRHLHSQSRHLQKYLRF